MDIKRIGEFIASLRNEKKMTQMELGEKLGVTNKTISRWENGNYMPSVEMLQMLSKEFDVSINEIISGERIIDENYKDEAEKNIISALKSNKFSTKEKQEYWKDKWLKDHTLTIIMYLVIVVGILIYGYSKKNNTIVGSNILFVIIGNTILRNRMMSYIEKKLYID